MRTVTVRVRPDGTWSGRLPALDRGEHLVAVRHVNREGHASPLSDAVDLLVVGAPTIVGGASIITSAASPLLPVLAPEGDDVETEVDP